MAIVHELSWSVSRASTFATCRRRYFWDDYGSWRGWERTADAERRKAYVLEKMTRMPMWAGDCLHVAIAEWFERRRTGEAPGLEPTLDRALARFRNGYRESRDGTWKQRPARMTHLAEHHFAEPDAAWIYDRKPGKPRDEDAFQLLLYAIYAEHRWGITPTAVTCVDACSR